MHDITSLLCVCICACAYVCVGVRVCMRMSLCVPFSTPQSTSLADPPCGAPARSDDTHTVHAPPLLQLLLLRILLPLHHQMHHCRRGPRASVADATARQRQRAVLLFFATATGMQGVWERCRARRYWRVRVMGWRRWGWQGGREGWAAGL